MSLPTGTVTFLFSDIEGSTRLLQRLGERYGSILDEHRAVMRRAVTEAGGHEVRTEGDAFFLVFSNAGSAVACALDAQRGMAAREWPADVQLRVRMGLHTGVANMEGDDYWGLTVHEAARIAAAAQGGQVIVSDETAAAAELPEGVTWRNLGVHRLKDLDRPIRLHQLCHASLPSDFVAPRTLSAIPHNLPEQLTSFIGRAGELAELETLVDRHRLLTIVGPGGCGKTRLSLQLGAAVLGRFDDGVWLAELAQVTDDVDVARTVGTALGVADEALSDPLPTLVERLRHARLLIVLDNCEHVVAGAAELAARLATSCPQAHLVATSREPLGVEGEQVWQIAPLDVPRDQEPGTPELLAQHESTRLFLDRARLARPDLDPAQVDPDAVVRICRRLDGIPLAIELAASRVRVMSLAQLDARLDDRFRLLTGGSRTALPRQQTLRATVDWSYELLDPASRLLLERLAVLGASFTLEAAEAVGAEGVVHEFDVLDLVGGLLHRSLLLLDDSAGAPRYRMLETIRQYALERLTERGEVRDTQRRLRSWVMALAAEGEPEHMGPNGPRWHDRFEQEWPHIRAAFESALDDPEGASDAASLIADLGLWYWLRAHHGEGRRWAEAVEARTHDVAPLLRARSLLAFGILAVAQLDVANAVPRLERCLRLAEELEEHLLSGWARCMLGVATAMGGDIDGGRQHLQQAVVIADTHADESMQAGLQYFVGTVGLLAGDREVARTHLGNAVALARGTGAPYVISRCLPVVGAGALAEGRTEEAMALFTEALEVARETHDRVNAARALAFLGDAALARGDLGAARAHLEEAAPIVTREVDGSTLTPRVLLLLASVDLRQGQVASARSHLDRALASIGELGARNRELADAERLRAELALLDGDRRTARSAIQSSIDVAGETKQPERVATALRLLARIEVAEGDARAAEEALAAAEHEVGRDMKPALAARLDAVRGEVELLRGNARAAVELLDRATSRLLQVGQVIAAADTAVVLASALGRLGRTEEALAIAGAAALAHRDAGVAPGGDGLLEPETVEVELRALAGGSAERWWQQGAAIGLERALVIEP